MMMYPVNKSTNYHQIANPGFKTRGYSVPHPLNILLIWWMNQELYIFHNSFSYLGLDSNLLGTHLICNMCSFASTKLEQQ